MPKPYTKVYDIVVVGAGAAGLFAAIAAARQGCSVCIVEKNQYAGGKATAAMVGTVCGLFLTDPSQQSQWAVGGIVKEFAENLAQMSASKPMRFYERLHFLPYKIEAFKNLSERYLKDFGVDVFYNYSVVDVSHNEGEIVSLSIQSGSEMINVSAAQFIDCSGEAHLSALCNMDWVEGGTNQAAARVFALDGIGEMPADAIHFVLSRIIQRGTNDGTLPAEAALLTAVPGSFNNGSASFKLGLSQTVTNDPVQRAEMMVSSEAAIHRCISYLNAASPVFAATKLSYIAPEVGFRTGYRSVGKAQLLAVDVINANKHQEAVANGAWPIEFWLPNHKVEIQHINDGDFYQISASTLESKHLKNLYFAGRNLSADLRAMASARVMGTCFQTGFAAGTLAAFSTGNGLRMAAITEIQNMLELNK